MKDLPLNALRAFAAVYAEGGVRAAARALGTAHSSVSRHLGELEKWLGVRLMHETAERRERELTAQGKALGKAALAALRDLERAVAAVREARPAHAVAIATTPSFAARWLLPRLPKLEAQHPRIEISILVDQRVVDLDAGGVDFAIRMGRGPWPGLRCEPLMDDRLYPVMSPALWNKSGRAEDPADLVHLRLLHDRDPSASWEAWRAAHGPSKLDVRRGPRYASSDLLLRAAAQGQGVALARHRLAADDIAAGLLVRPCGERDVVLRDAYWLVFPAHESSRLAVKTVIAWLRREAR